MVKIKLVGCNFHPTSKKWDLNHNFIQIIDGYLEAKRIEDEFNKKKEVIDFLNQLP